MWDFGPTLRNLILELFPLGKIFQPDDSWKKRASSKMQAFLWLFWESFVSPCALTSPHRLCPPFAPEFLSETRERLFSSLEGQKVGETEVKDLSLVTSCWQLLLHWGAGSSGFHYRFPFSF